MFKQCLSKKEEHYSLNLFVTLTYICGKPQDQCNGIRRQRLLIEMSEVALIPYKVIIRSWPCQHPSLGLLASQTMRNKCTTQSVVFCYSSSTKTGRKREMVIKSRGNKINEKIGLNPSPSTVTFNANDFKHTT